MMDAQPVLGLEHWRISTGSWDSSAVLNAICASNSQTALEGLVQPLTHEIRA